MDVGVYALRFPDGSFYIGSTVSFHTRWKDHRGRLRQENHRNYVLQHAWNLHKSLTASPLLVCRKEDLLFYEQLCIERFNPSLNLLLIAGGRVTWSPEKRARMSQLMKGRKHTPEAKAKISRGKKGISTGPQSAATRLKRGKALVGNKNALGSKMSDKEKARLSLLMKGNSRALGNKLSPRQKAKISANLIGNQRTLGRKRTPEEKMRIGNKMKQIWAQKRAKRNQNVDG